MLASLGAPHPTLAYALKDDAAAVQFAQMLVRICDVWDDLIDRDAAVAPDDIQQAFYLALCGLPANPFYRVHFDALHPLLVSGVLSWWASNALERQPIRRARMIAYTGRSQIAEAIVMAALLVGGVDWARAVAPDIKLMIHSDDPSAYLTEMESKHGMDVGTKA
jgi:hypothetical protein